MTVPEERPAVNAMAGAYEAQVMALAAALDPAVHGHDTLRYGEEGHQTLDLFRPAVGAGEALPLMLFFHGGGFTHGNPRWNHFVAPLMTGVPMLFASVRYRLMDEGDEGAAPYEDVAAALGWARREIAAFGGNADRLFVGGHSAGAALAAGICARGAMLAKEGVPMAALRGALCLSPSLGRHAVTGTAGSAYALPDGPLPLASDAPLALVDAMATPMLVGWGGQERQRMRVERSAMAMIGALRDRSVPVDWMFLQEASHFDTHLVLADPAHPWSVKIGEWLRGLS